MKKGFTLAEVLITLAIIGVVAAMTIPSVIVNTNQQQFKTGLRKAVSVLNSAITTTQAIDGLSPYDAEGDIETVTRMQSMATAGATNNLDDDEITLYHILTAHMSVMNTKGYKEGTNGYNLAFYTTDGMRFEIPMSDEKTLPLYESDEYSVALGLQGRIAEIGGAEGAKCGSLGLASNNGDTKSTPCLILVDVNGDKKPNPKNIRISEDNEVTHDKYSYPSPNDKLVNDIFPILITESKAIPYGVVAQRAMYEANKK